MTRHDHGHPAAVTPAEVLDPVCGMTLSPDDAVGHVDHKGQTYYFCSQSCLADSCPRPALWLRRKRTG